VVVEMAREVLPVVRHTPVLAGVNGTDPFMIRDHFLPRLAGLGFSGIQNFPSVGLIDGVFRANLEETGMGFGPEIDLIRAAHELDLLTTPYVFDAEQARDMTKAGADVIVCHMGLTTGGATNRINITSVPPSASYPVQVTLIKYPASIGGAGYNFGLGTLPALTSGYLSNNAAKASVDLVLTSGPFTFTWTGSINANWGVWLTGSITENVGTTSFPGGAHYLFGNLTPPDVIASKTGTLVMGPIGGTTPTSNMLGNATSFTYPAIGLNFTTRQATVDQFTWPFNPGSFIFPRRANGPSIVGPGKGAEIKVA